MSDYPMLISNKLHSFRNFMLQRYNLLDKSCNAGQYPPGFFIAPKLSPKNALRRNVQQNCSQEVSCQLKILKHWYLR